MRLVDFLEHAGNDPDYIGDHREFLRPVHGAEVDQIRASYAQARPADDHAPVTVATLVHDRSQFDLHLSKSLQWQPKEIEVLVEWNADNHIKLARYYNQVLDAAHHDRILFCHPDIEFSPGALSLMQRQFDEQPAVGAVGLVGANLAKRAIWSGSQRKPKLVSTLDSCAMMVDRRQGFRFDEQTFDGFHCVIEDYCLQVQDAGRTVCVAAPALCAHWGSTLLGIPGNHDRWMSDFERYFQRLEEKWPGRWFCTTAGGWGGPAREICASYFELRACLERAERKLRRRSPSYLLSRACSLPFDLGAKLLGRRKSA